MMERLQTKIEADRKAAAQKGDVERLYIIELARKWIELRVKDAESFEKTVSALAKIFDTPEFQKAMAFSKELCRADSYDPEKGREAAAQIVKLSESAVYAECAPIAGYHILDKFKKAETYRTDAFVIHSNMTTRLCEYLLTLTEETNQNVRIIP